MRPTTTAPELPGYARALATLLRSTQTRPLSVAEARAKLAAKEHEADTIAAVIAKARSLGILDDAAFARAWVTDRGLTRGYGEARLRRELRRRQVVDEAVDKAMELLADVDEVAQATEIARVRAQRMPATLAPERVAQRLVGLLVRRGFSADVAHQVARRVSSLDQEWD